MWKSLFDTVKNENFQLLIKLPPDLQLLQMFACLSFVYLDDNARVHAFKTVLNFLASVRVSLSIPIKLLTYSLPKISFSYLR